MNERKKFTIICCFVMALAVAAVAFAAWWLCASVAQKDGESLPSSSSSFSDAGGTVGDQSGAGADSRAEGGGRDEASGGDYGWSALGFVDEGDTPSRPEGWMGPEDESLEYYQREIITDENGNERAKGLLAVRFEKEAGEERMREIVRELGCRWVGGVMRDSSYIKDISVDVLVPDGASEKEYAALFEAYDEVVYAVPYVAAGALTEQATSTDIAQDGASRGLVIADASQKYHLSAARFYSAWDIVKCNGSVTVAVLDSGKPKKIASDIELSIDYDHAYDATVDGVQFGADPVGHGTAVAGVISAIADNGAGTDGASYNAKILPVKVTCGDTEKVYAEDLINGLDYLLGLENIPDVVNMSVGLSLSENPENGITKDQVDSLIWYISQLHVRNVVLVAASGNITPFSPDVPMYPACLAGVLSVGALAAPSQADLPTVLESGGYPNAQLAGFSVTHSDTDLVAYGQGIWVISPMPLDVPGFTLAQMDGTSFSAPQVAAAAALVKAAHPGYRAENIESALIQTAVKLPVMEEKEKTEEFGYGALDAAAAVMWSNMEGSGGSGGSGSGDSGGSGTGGNWSPTAGGSLLDTYREAKEQQAA